MNQHVHAFEVARSGKVALCTHCSRWYFVDVKPEDIITEQRD